MPTYRVYSTPGSQSKTSTYVEELPKVAKDMQRWNTDPSRAHAIVHKEIRAYRQACSYHRINGNFTRAWFYIASLSRARSASRTFHTPCCCSCERKVTWIFGRFRPRLLAGGGPPARRIEPMSAPLFLLLCLAILFDDRALF